MTKLNDTQERILQGVKDTFADILPVLQKMEEDYEYAVYRAKKPLRESVDDALANGVPLKRIAEDAAGFAYPQKLKLWLRPSDALMERLAGGDVVLQTADTFTEDIESIESVTRDPKTGVFHVTHRGGEYKVPALGPDEEPWSSREQSVPQAVYDLIAAKYPSYVVLDEEDD